MKNVGVLEPGRNARSMLDLQDPHLDWTHLARGMGVDVDTAPARGLEREGGQLVLGGNRGHGFFLPHVARRCSAPVCSRGR